MEQNVLRGKELIEERSRILFFAHRALERILGLAKPLLETLFMDRHASLAAATASLHQLAFFETNIARHGCTWMGLTYSSMSMSSIFLLKHVKKKGRNPFSFLFYMLVFTGE